MSIERVLYGKRGDEECFLDKKKTENEKHCMNRRNRTPNMFKLSEPIERQSQFQNSTTTKKVLFCPFRFLFLLKIQKVT